MSAQSNENEGSLFYFPKGGNTCNESSVAVYCILAMSYLPASISYYTAVAICGWL